MDREETRPDVGFPGRAIIDEMGFINQLKAMDVCVE